MEPKRLRNPQKGGIHVTYFNFVSATVLAGGASVQVGMVMVCIYFLVRCAVAKRVAASILDDWENRIGGLDQAQMPRRGSMSTGLFI